jgi:hypothetical protein
MEDWNSSIHWKSYIVLTCITCEKVVLLTIKDEILRAMENEITINVFLPTVCFSCEKDERKKVACRKSDKEITMAMWTSLSISHHIIRMWEPYNSMKSFLHGQLSLPERKVSLVQRDRVRDAIESNYTVRSVILNPDTETAAEVLPYLQSGFF